MRSSNGIMELVTLHPRCPCGGGSSACLMTVFPFPAVLPCMVNTVDPLCVMGKLLATVANIIALCLLNVQEICGPNEVC